MHLPESTPRDSVPLGPIGRSAGCRHHAKSTSASELASLHTTYAAGRSGAPRSSKRRRYGHARQQSRSTAPTRQQATRSSVMRVRRCPHVSAVDRCARYGTPLRDSEEFDDQLGPADWIDRMVLTSCRCRRFELTAAELSIVVDRREEAALQAVLPGDKLSPRTEELAIDDRPRLTAADDPLGSSDH
jgi:hypothetical protein